MLRIDRLYCELRIPTVPVWRKTTCLTATKRQLPPNNSLNRKKPNFKVIAVPVSGTTSIPSWMLAGWSYECYCPSAGINNCLLELQDTTCLERSNLSCKRHGKAKLQNVFCSFSKRSHVPRGPASSSNSHLVLPSQLTPRKTTTCERPPPISGNKWIFHTRALFQQKHQLLFPADRQRSSQRWNRTFCFESSRGSASFGRDSKDVHLHVYAQRKNRARCAQKQITQRRQTFF